MAGTKTKGCANCLGGILGRPNGVLGNGRKKAKPSEGGGERGRNLVLWDANLAREAGERPGAF